MYQYRQYKLAFFLIQILELQNCISILYFPEYLYPILFRYRYCTILEYTAYD